jgi:iron complex transport system ATP-binding protein
MNPVLTVESLGFAYRKRPVLRGISFNVKEGEVCGLLGPNASGKTTLLKCISGVLAPQEGGVWIGAQSIPELPRQRAARLMAVVPQQASSVFSFTVLQMVIMGRAARLGKLSLPSRKDKVDAEKALDDLGILQLAPRSFGELSGGERQLVLLARALFQDTPVLLLDEPTSHLDFRNQYMIMDTVTAVTKKKNLATIVSLHDPNLAARYCTRLVMLKAGSLFHAGPTMTVFDPCVLREVYGMEVRVEQTEGGASIVLPARQTGGTQVTDPDDRAQRDNTQQLSSLP